MKKFKFFQPYKSNGQTTFPETRKKSGCYLIKENGKLVYVGYSAYNLYKTLYRHFQRWNHSTQEVISYKGKTRNKYTVRIIYCTPAQAAKLEKALILKHQPRDNAQKYAGHQETKAEKAILEDYEFIPTSNECPF